MKGILIIAPLVMVIALGMVLRATGFVKQADRDSLTKLLYWVMLPALLFRTAYLAGDKIGWGDNIFAAAYAVMFVTPVAALAMAAALIHRGDRVRQAVSVMASARANNVYLGLPACALALGEAGSEAASVYLALMLPGYNLISITFGEVVSSGRISVAIFQSAASRVLKNPLVISSVAGLIAAQLKMPVPDMVMTSLKLVADMATGIALMSLGMGLEFSGLASAFRAAWHDALIKLVLHPAITWLFCIVWPVPEIFLRVAVIISAMPTAVNTFIVSRGMKLDERYACEVIAVSTILAPVTIPVWIALLGIK